MSSQIIFWSRFCIQSLIVCEIVWDIFTRFLLQLILQVTLILILSEENSILKYLAISVLEFLFQFIFLTSYRSYFVILLYIFSSPQEPLGFDFFDRKTNYTPPCFWGNRFEGGIVSSNTRDGQKVLYNSWVGRVKIWLSVGRVSRVGLENVGRVKNSFTIPIGISWVELESDST